MKHASIPVFVPHLACPNDCVFCNQKKIAGTEAPVEDVFGYLKESLEKMTGSFDEVDIAFFGGSFTGIEKPRMIEYLRAADFFRQKDKRITGIRLSTRPDYINKEILEILKEYKVTAIELGVQSLCDKVLDASGRGHNAEATVNAVKMIREYDFELILQLMPGLPSDTAETIFYTAHKAAGLRPDGVRLYPCVVIKETELFRLYEKGLFEPLSVEKAVDICAEMTIIFEQAGIKILRTGLHSSDLVKNGGVAAGPFHPAFGEMVRQKIYMNAADRLVAEQLKIFETRFENKIVGNTSGNKKVEKTGISKNSGEKYILLSVARGCVSKMIGQKRKNMKILTKKYGLPIRVAENETLSGNELKAEIIGT